MLMLPALVMVMVLVMVLALTPPAMVVLLAMVSPTTRPLRTHHRPLPTLRAPTVPRMVRRPTQPAGRAKVLSMVTVSMAKSAVLVRVRVTAVKRWSPRQAKVEAAATLATAAAVAAAAAAEKEAVPAAVAADVATVAAAAEAVATVCIAAVTAAAAAGEVAVAAAAAAPAVTAVDVAITADHGHHHVGRAAMVVAEAATGTAEAAVPTAAVARIAVAAGAVGRRVGSGCVQSGRRGWCKEPTAGVGLCEHLNILRRRRGRGTQQRSSSAVDDARLIR